MTTYETPEQRFRTGRVLSRGRMLLSLLLGLTVAVLIIVFISTAHLGGLRQINIVWMLVLLLFSLFVVLFTHEGGHLLAARLVGFRFLLLIVGPLKLSRYGDGLRPGLNTHLALAGGLAAATPRGTESDLARRMLVMTAGGPGASLALAIVGIVLAALLPVSSLLGSVLSIIGFMSLGIFAVTMLSAKTSGYLTDGARILALVQGGEDVGRLNALALLQNEVIAGRLPREWDTRLVDQATSLNDGSPDDLAGCYYGYYFALDRGDIERAERLLTRLQKHLSKASTVLQKAIALEIAYFEARYRHHPQLARKWWERSRGAFADACTRLRVEAAVLLSEGREQEARAKVNEGLRQIKRATFPGTARMEEVWLRALLETHPNA